MSIVEVIESLASLVPVLKDYKDVLAAVEQMIEAGASKESIIAAVQKAEISASDTMMREELGMPPA